MVYVERSLNCHLEDAKSKQNPVFNVINNTFEYIYNDGEAMIYFYHYAHFRHIDSGS